jgi:geranylgeranyl diphosphate synthase type II
MLSQYQRWVDSAIKRYRFGKSPESLYEPIRYLMGLGGKRLRPMLTLLAYSLYRDDVKSIIPYAVAVEGFHNFTLMHDDIMDNAPLRRGKVTVHEKWNVNTAILSGDVMLIKVYDMFLGLEAKTLKEVLTAFNACAAEVCEGQQWDMEFETTERVSEKQYLSMIRQKTATLLGFALELGAILAGAPLHERKALREFGINIGIGFQLRDDYLDAFADPKKFGKQVGGDILANKKTYLLIKALERARGKTLKDLQYWLKAKRFRKKEKVDAVKAIYEELGIPSLVNRKADQYFQKGFGQLALLEEGERQTDKLVNFARRLVERQT